MKQIKLTHGKVALVDDADYDWLNQWKWYASRNRDTWYAKRDIRLSSGKQFSISMARQILGLESGDKKQADHINHNTLNNCRDNLRICTLRQNQRNQKPQRNAVSQFKGVSWYKSLGKWIARIGINKEKKYLGCFTKEKDAALAYDKAAIQEHGEFAHLNF